MAQSSFGCHIVAFFTTSLPMEKLTKDKHNGNVCYCIFYRINSSHHRVRKREIIFSLVDIWHGYFHSCITSLIDNKAKSEGAYR